MSKATRATRQLDAAKVAYAVHAYDYDGDVERIGMAAAAALGVDAAKVFKTLMVLADGKPACVILPADREVAMKKLAAALGAKQAQMMPIADAERISGYKVGGISPFGQTRRLAVVIDEAAQAQERIFLNGGQRGLQVELAPGDAARVLDARLAAITA
ncbi:MAG TPA: Cys-tRNA(Pro) deacylase [Novosphingobium sp.]|nr:Cys-tRNA(Pro) deacylase [Novosphingobium sp.]